MIGELAKWLVGFGLARWLIVAGLVITLIGAWLGLNGVWVTEDQALEIGQARWSGTTESRVFSSPPCKICSGSPALPGGALPSSDLALFCRSWVWS